MRNYSREQFEKLDIWTFWQFPSVIHNQFPNDDSWLTKGNSCSLNNHQYCETRTDPKLKPCTVQLSSRGLIKQIASRAVQCALCDYSHQDLPFTYKSICKLIIWTKIFAIDYTGLTSSSERLGLPECMSWAVWPLVRPHTNKASLSSLLPAYQMHHQSDLLLWNILVDA